MHQRHVTTTVMTMMMMMMTTTTTTTSGVVKICRNAAKLSSGPRQIVWNRSGAPRVTNPGL